MFHGYQAPEDEWGDPTDLYINSVGDWKNFLSTNDYAILDEYDEEISFDDFFKLVEEKQKENNKDDFKYNSNIDGYRFSFRDFS